MNLLPLFAALPIIAAFINYVIPERRKIFSDILANLVTFFLAGLSVFFVFVLRDAGRIVYHVGGWKAPIGIDLVMDGFSLLMIVTANVIAFLSSLYSAGFMNRYTSKGKYYTVFLLMLAGINGVIITGDLFNLYVFLEIASIASYILVAFGTGQEEFEASFKYAIMGIIGSSLIIIGIAFSYAMTGTLNMAHFAGIISGSGPGFAIFFITALFLAGFSLKAAIMPFHAWLPDAHPAAPAPVSSMLSGVLIKAVGIYAMIRIFFNVIGITREISGIILMLGIVSMIIGIGLAILQWDFKRTLAYSTISQAGYVMLGFGVAGIAISGKMDPKIAYLAVFGALFHIVNHAVYKSLLFLNSGAIEMATGKRDLREMNLAGEKMKVTNITSTIASLAIGGVPPFSGFFSKLFIIIACFGAGLKGYGFLAALTGILTLATFLKFQRYAVFGRSSTDIPGKIKIPMTMQVSMVVLAALCLLSVLLLIEPLKGLFLDRAADVLVSGTAYTGVLGE